MVRTEPQPSPNGRYVIADIPAEVGFGDQLNQLHAVGALGGALGYELVYQPLASSRTAGDPWRILGPERAFPPFDCRHATLPTRRLVVDPAELLEWSIPRELDPIEVLGSRVEAQPLPHVLSLRLDGDRDLLWSLLRGQMPERVAEVGRRFCSLLPTDWGSRAFDGTPTLCVAICLREGDVAAVPQPWGPPWTFWPGRAARADSRWWDELAAARLIIRALGRRFAGRIQFAVFSDGFARTRNVASSALRDLPASRRELLDDLIEDREQQLRSIGELQGSRLFVGEDASSLCELLGAVCRADLILAADHQRLPTKVLATLGADDKTRCLGILGRSHEHLDYHRLLIDPRLVRVVGLPWRTFSLVPLFRFLERRLDEIERPTEEVGVRREEDIEPDRWLDRAAEREAAGDDEEARYALLRATDLMGRAPPPLAGLARATARLGRCREAEDALRELETNRRLEATLGRNRAWIDATMGRHHAARRHLGVTREVLSDCEELEKIAALETHVDRALRLRRYLSRPHGSRVLRRQLFELGANPFRPRACCQIDGIELLYRELFGDREQGLFLEIGAFDGESYSNTCFLADLGWSGVYVEPVAEAAEKCALRHARNRVEVLRVAVGPRKGEAEISVAGEFSSMVHHHIEQFAAHGISDHRRNLENGTRRRVPVVTMEEVRLRLPSCALDLLVIDAEGAELQIVESTDWNVLAPSVIVIELRDRNERFSAAIRDESRRIIRRLKRHGYLLLHQDRLNGLFVSHDAARSSGLVAFDRARARRRRGEVTAWFDAALEAAETNPRSPRMAFELFRAARAAGLGDMAHVALDLCRTLEGRRFFAGESRRLGEIGEEEGAIEAATAAVALDVDRSPETLELLATAVERIGSSATAIRSEIAVAQRVDELLSPDREDVDE